MIVIVDDRGSVADAYQHSFSREGVSATGFTSTDFEGWVLAAAEDDVLAVEAVLIGECASPAAIAHIIKRRCTAAIIAMKDQRSLIGTLELFAGGVDDVVTKPCHVREILARIEAISRRSRIAIDTAGVDDLSIRVFKDGREPLLDGEPFPLPRRELRILEFLFINRNRRVTKSQIFNTVYGIFDQDVDETVIESHICKLRRRLRMRLGYDPVCSKRHLGYQLVPRRTSSSDEHADISHRSECRNTIEGSASA
jgi:DNA-binding response OmpR family regulator